MVYSLYVTARPYNIRSCHDCVHYMLYHELCMLHECTGWRRLIRSPKLQIIFHKRAIKYWSLLRKMTYKDKGSYESSPPCIINLYNVCCIVNLYLYGVCMVYSLYVTGHISHKIVIQGGEDS